MPNRKIHAPACTAYCSDCEEDTIFEYDRGFSGSREEPPEPAGWFCIYCGEPLPRDADPFDVYDPEEY